MTILFDHFARNDLLKRGRAEAIIGGVRTAVVKWPDYAEQAQMAEIGADKSSTRSGWNW